ncbi:MAG: hypothetical protein JEZ02_06055 [Desulfatibacillum sp.]|nr:hypothetical protein [Desulfatibacillum sp.]
MQTYITGMATSDYLSGALGTLCRQHRLMQPDEDNIMRLPFLIKGELRVPVPVEPEVIFLAFVDAEREALPGVVPTHVNLGRAQVLREPVIDRETMRNTGEFLYTVMPVFTPEEVIETDIPALCKDLYNMPFSRVTELLGDLSQTFSQNRLLLDYVRDVTVQTAMLPDLWHDMGFEALAMMLDPESAQQMVDRDLCAWGVDGSRLLDDWVELEQAKVLPAPVHVIAAQALGGKAPPWETRTPALRAMPTRQLHITAGNAPQIPFISALRAILTKSAAVVKSPYGATLPGALLALALVATAPDHPITRHLSIVYWPGGDGSVEDAFFMPGSFDRIVVWGAPGAVESVKKRALFTKVLTFNPRYGVSLIARESLEGDMDSLASRAVTDSLVANQKACIASQIHYVEGDRDRVKAYALALQKALAAFDRIAPNYVEPHFVGELKRVMRGVLIDGEWFVNQKNGFWRSGVVVMDREVPLSAVTMQRMIIVRRVDDISRALAHLHPGVSTVSVSTPSLKNKIRDIAAASGVSNVVDLGHSGTMFPGMSHDGMMVLSELVDWKNG